MGRFGRKRVLIAGGGVAGLEAALALRHLAPDQVEVELLAPEPHFWYRPLAVAVPFGQGEVLRLELDGLARRIGASLTPGGLVAIDAWRHIAHTSKNAQLEYDMLLIACGATSVPAIPGAETFRGPPDIDLIEGVLADLATKEIRSVAYAIPWGAVYSLPAYELALLTAAHLDRAGVQGVEVTLVTPEDEPLQVFGPAASRALDGLLSDRGIDIRTGAYPKEVVDGALRLIPDGVVQADRVVALARLVGPPIDGIPQTVHGFIPVDAHCRVHGVADVYAAGDVTSFTVKHGGLATQQADAAAETIAAAAGADVEPARFRPVLRGVLLTGSQPRYLRRELAFQPDTEPIASLEPLWWPSAKVVGRHLAPFLAELTGEEAATALPEDRESVAVELALEQSGAPLAPVRMLENAPSEDDPRAADVMSAEVAVVAPEDTLGEAAERMLAVQARVAAVAEFGAVIGILTSSDLLRAAAARAHPAEARARQWMTAEPVTVSAELPVGSARILMEQYGVDQLPVLDGDKLVGMVDREQVDRQLVVSPGLGF